jgi:hypothetical protein
MDRRAFLRGLLGVGVVVAACTKSPPGAEAAPLAPKPTDLDAAAKALESVPDEGSGVETENQYYYYGPRRRYRPRRYYYYRRPVRRYYRRRRYYARPRFYYRW